MPKLVAVRIDEHQGRIRVIGFTHRGKNRKAHVACTLPHLDKPLVREAMLELEDKLKKDDRP